MKTQEQLLEQLERVFELPPAEPNERGRLGLLQLGATRLEAIGGRAVIYNKSTSVILDVFIPF